MNRESNGWRKLSNDTGRNGNRACVGNMEFWRPQRIRKGGVSFGNEVSVQKLRTFRADSSQDGETVSD